MKYLECRIIYEALYRTRIALPKEIHSLNEAIEYMKERISQMPLGEMDFISARDILDEKSCKLYENDEETDFPDRTFINVED